MISNWYQ